MSKELPFFKFEPAQWAFGRIQRQSSDVKAAFIDLCCKYWHNLGVMSVEDASLDFGEEEVETMIKKKIVQVDQQQNIRVKFLDDQLSAIEENSKKQSERGKKSAAKRAEKKAQQQASGSTTVQPPFNHVSTDKIREEEIREDKEKINNAAAISFKEKKELEKELHASEQWHEKVIRNFDAIGHKLNHESIKEWLTVFCLELDAKDDIDKSLRSQKMHFINWLRNQLTKSNTTNNANRKSRLERFIDGK